jgi:hypothetical protein
MAKLVNYRFPVQLRIFFESCSSKTHVLLWKGSLRFTHDLRHTHIRLFENGDTLWLLNIAMENGPVIDGLPIKHGWIFPWLTVSHNQMVHSANNEFEWWKGWTTIGFYWVACHPQITGSADISKVWQLKGFGWPAMDNESFLGQYRVDSLVIGTLIYFNYPVVKGAAIGG